MASLQLLKYHEGQYLIPSETKEFLTTVLADTPLAPISAAGPMRSGKSYLLNLLLEIPNAFSMSGTVHSETRGVWISKKTQPIHNNGISYHILYCDTEGLNSPDSKLELDTKIFVFAMLISSKFMFNSKGAILANSLEDLKVAGKFAEIMKQNSSCHLSLASLLWILRDFNLNIVDQKGQSTSATQYLNSSLEQIGGDTAKAIYEIFPSRAALALCPPTENQHDLKFMRNFVPAFQNGMALLKNEILKTPVKLIGNAMMTGSMLYTMAETFCKIFNTNEGIPKIQSVWESTCEVATIKAMSIISEKTSSILLNSSNQVWSSKQIQELPLTIVTLLYTTLPQPPTKDQIQQALRKSLDLIQEYQKQSNNKYISSLKKRVDQQLKNIVMDQTSFQELMRLILVDVDEQSLNLCDSVFQVCTESVSKLHEHIKQLGHQFDLIKNEYNEYKIQNESNIEDLKKQLESQQETSLTEQLFLNKIETLTDMKIQVEFERDDLKVQLTSLKKQLDDSNVMFEVIKEQLTNLMVDRDDLNELKTTKKELDKSLKELKEKYNQEQLTIQELKKQVESLNDTNKKLNEKYILEVKESQSAKRLRTETEAERKIMEQELKQYKQHKVNSENSIASLTTELAMVKQQNRIDHLFKTFPKI